VAKAQSSTSDANSTGDFGENGSPPFSQTKGSVAIPALTAGSHVSRLTRSASTTLSFGSSHSKDAVLLLTVSSAKSDITAGQQAEANMMPEQYEKTKANRRRRWGPWGVNAEALDPENGEEGGGKVKSKDGDDEEDVEGEGEDEGGSENGEDSEGETNQAGQATLWTEMVSNQDDDDLPSKATTHFIHILSTSYIPPLTSDIAFEFLSQASRVCLTMKSAAESSSAGFSLDL